MNNKDLDLESHFNSFIYKNYNNNHWSCKYPKLAKEWDENKNKELGINSIIEHNNPNKNIWWKCNECNNSYLARLILKIENYSKDNHSDCSFCNFKNSNEYGLIINHWNYEKNGEIGIKPLKNDKFWFKYPNCNHETYNTFGNFIKSGITCKECLSAENKKTLLEKAAKESAEISFLKSRSSSIEKKLYYFLYLIFDTEVLSGESFKAPGYKNTFEIDIFIKRLKLGLEYDGVYFHTDFNRDFLKNQKCKAAGIKLLRIREEGLEKVSDDDIIYNHKNYDVNSLVNLVCDWLSINYILNPNELNKISELKELDLNEYIIPTEFNIYPIKQNSIANKFPKLHSSWHDELNVKMGLEFNLLNILPTSSLRNKNCFWKCKKCKLVWMDSILNRMEKDGCPSCENKAEDEINYSNVNDNLGILKDFNALRISIDKAVSYNTKFLGPLKIKSMGVETRKELRYMKLIMDTIRDKLNYKSSEYNGEIMNEFKTKKRNLYFENSNVLINHCSDVITVK